MDLTARGVGRTPIGRRQVLTGRPHAAVWRESAAQAPLHGATVPPPCDKHYGAPAIGGVPQKPREPTP